MPATHHGVEDDAGQDHVAALPAVLAQQEGGKWREHERAEAGAAHSDPSGQRAPRLEVVVDGHDRRQVDQTEPKSWEHRGGR